MEGSDQAVPERLPLLDAFLARRASREPPLAGVTAVLIQHQLGSVVPMTRALLELGLEARRTHFVDIPYTANPVVRQHLEALGIPRENFAPSAFNLEQPYAAYQRRRVQTLITALRASLAPTDRVLVVDDGSYFVEAMSCFARPLENLRCVEQTTRGIIKITHDAAMRDLVGRIAVVNVAQSVPKNRWEGTFIGEAVCRALGECLAGPAALRPGDRCLVLGYGTIGQAVAASLHRDVGLDRARIRIHDPGAAAQKKAIGDGFAPWDRDQPARERFRLVVGCSGQTSFTVSDRVFLEDGAVLASASSGSAELSREQFIELADTHPSDDIYVVDRDTLASRPIHSPVDLRLVDRTVRFLNGGFPVNFDGRVNCVPPRRIQATHTLLVGAAVQAMQSRETGLLPVSPPLCRWVDQAYLRLLSLDALTGPRPPA
jgi:S-adenosylhomocysteine hydrolase